MPIVLGPDASKPKSIAALIVDKMGQETEPKGDMDGPFLGKQLIAAIDSKDERRVYAAFQALFKHCEMEPHQEYNEENESEY